MIRVSQAITVNDTSHPKTIKEHEKWTKKEDKAPEVTITFNETLVEINDEEGAMTARISLAELVPLIDALTKLADELGVAS